MRLIFGIIGGIFQLVLLFVVLLAILFAFFYFASGTEKIINYNYEIQTLETEFGPLEVELRGDFLTVRKEHITYTTNPYSLIMFFRTGEVVYDKVEFSNFKITDSAGLSLKIPDKSTTDNHDYDLPIYNYYAHVYSKFPELKYADKVITGKITVYKNGKEKSIEVKAILKTDYSEETESYFISAIMSV